MEQGVDVEQIGHFIYGFHGIVSLDELRGLPAVGTVPPVLAERGAVLARRFEAVLADLGDGSGAVSGDRMDALLRDARTLAAELAYARH